jgi:hypothetical protein
VYQTEQHLEPPVWLNLDAVLLGTQLLTVPSGAESILSGLAGQRAWRAEPLPVFLAPEMMPTQSVFRLEGSLAERLLGGPPALRVWTNSHILTHSTVQIAVDPAGEVIATRLDARCGLADADADAVAKARALRFRPSPSAGTRWGEAVFEWQTTEPPGAGPPK